ncbi:MAG: dimethyl sulfoxide reductase anchor subunit family protein [Dokdonella sp.]|uniref:dimethyl sulfoxide reductase anchor subunit family protein n=1 Tax=Dokdonella sp. TaxID=2291710 RepID=UPI003F7D126B
MRPTFSIICFTVLSGIGYGAWFLIGLAFAIGPMCEPAYTRVQGMPLTTLFASRAGFPAAFVLVALGLCCSLAHLGKPLRAWRALSQWRSSWLSREGVLALLTFLPAVAIAVPWSMIVLSRHATIDVAGDRCAGLGTLRMLGLLLAVGSFATVFCTAHIYSSLKPIRAWSDRHVVPMYLLMALHGGVLLMWVSWTVEGIPDADRRILLPAAIALAVACAWLKSRYWRAIDAQPAANAGHATGLDALGAVRSFEQPHTEENYLTHEMGFVLARKHARRLRTIAMIAAFGAPALLAALALGATPLSAVAAVLAFASGAIGLFVERWLFFAEAKHAVMAYYQR